jgi:adenylosuccinate lyase
MRENLELTRGLAFSGTLLLALTEKGLTREDAYARVQGHAMDTWDHGGDYRERVLADARITAVLSKEEVDRAFSLDESLRHVDAIFERTLGAEEMSS